MFINTTIGFWGGIKEWTTSSALVKRKSQQIRTIPQALEIKTNPKAKEALSKPPTTFEKSIGWLKKGHVLGLGWLLVSAGSDWLCKLYEVDDKSFLYSIIKTNLPFGTAGAIGSILAATFCENQTEKLERGKLDLFAQRITVNKDGTSKLSNGVESSKKYADLETDVILTPYNREKLEMGLRRAQEEKRGGIFLLRGMSRCGKTMTAEAVTRKLAQEKGKAYFWDITEEGMEKNFADFSKDFGAFFGHESTTSRLERIVSNAILEDAPVVILLDEAHLMVGSTGSKDYNPNDPMQRSDILNNIQKFISSRFKTSDCKDVYIFLTTNSSTNDIATTMAGRMDAVLDYDKPTFEQRKELIRKILQKEMASRQESMPFQFSDFSNTDSGKKPEFTIGQLKALGSKTKYCDYQEIEEEITVSGKTLTTVNGKEVLLKEDAVLGIEAIKPEDIELLYKDGKIDDLTYMASSGTIDLLEQFYLGSKKLAIEEARYDGFGGRLEILKERPLIQYEILEAVVKNAVIKAADKKLADKKAVCDYIRASLEEAVSNILKQRSWRSEVVYTFGNNEEKYRTRSRVA